MGIDAKEKTARSTSVGADERQSIQKDSDNSIPASEAKGNGEMENLEEMYRKMQRMADPHYLHTLTMTCLLYTSLSGLPGRRGDAALLHRRKPGRGPGGPPGPAGGLLRGAGLRRSVRLRNEHPARPGPHRGRGLRLGSGAALFRRMRPVLCRERRPAHLFGTEMNTAAVFAALHSKARRNGRYFVLQSLLYA